MNEELKKLLGEAVVKLSQHLQKQFEVVKMQPQMKVVICMDLLSAMIAKDIELTETEKEKLFEYITINVSQYATFLLENRN